MALYPYTFDPIYKDKIWGGRNLERLFGRSLPAGKEIGESWELADLSVGQSAVSGGPDKGLAIAELMRRHGREILGSAKPVAGGQFPLLIKYLDANDTLSLQVHPDEKAAGRLGPPAAVKTECWYIIESRGGFILKGVKPSVTERDFRRALQAEKSGEGSKALEDLVQRIDVRAGDFHYIPAGTVHALGAGLVVAEIQTPSDTTYRVSDWGRGREIHVEEALACIRFAPSPVDEPRTGVLVENAYFAVELLDVRPGRRKVPAGRCRTWMVLHGRGQVEYAGGGPLALVPGQTVVLPAALACELAAAETMTILETTLPG